MKNLEIRIIGGEVYVPLYAVVALLKEANPLAVQISQKIAPPPGQIARQLELQAAQAVVGGGLSGNAFVPPEGDYRGLGS